MMSANLMREKLRQAILLKTKEYESKIKNEQDTNK